MAASCVCGTQRPSAGSPAVSGEPHRRNTIVPHRRAIMPAGVRPDSMLRGGVRQGRRGLACGGTRRWGPPSTADDVRQRSLRQPQSAVDRCCSTAWIPHRTLSTSEVRMFTDPDQLLRYLTDEAVEFVDVRFCDLLGVMQHFTIPAESFSGDVFAEGVAFDGSSIRGFQQIHESDMLLLPDVATAFVDPFRKVKTVALNFFIHDPFTLEAYSRDPRNVARKAEAYLAASGIADTAYFGPEAEFYVFDSIRHETSANRGYYYIDS